MYEHLHKNILLFIISYKILPEMSFKKAHARAEQCFCIRDPITNTLQKNIFFAL